MHKINAFFNELPEWIFKLIAILYQTHLWVLAKLIMDLLVAKVNAHNVPRNGKRTFNPGTLRRTGYFA